HGVVAAKANLFEGKQTIICQLQENSAADVALVESFWQALGSRIKRISAIQHDAIYAAVSHLPHLLSYALMTSVLNSEDAEHRLLMLRVTMPDSKYFLIQARSSDP
ncbi:MAG: prephenate dehydrogenase/arogenate dehydrogenase family protein, partial [Burkholderiaceae bacterium]|nr:prephenate dehydrogenase/arogenate dehydrogenase family protein [Burkholderiaceae bacterium]